MHPIPCCQRNLNFSASVASLTCINSFNDFLRISCSSKSYLAWPTIRGSISTCLLPESSCASHARQTIGHAPEPPGCSVYRHHPAHCFTPWKGILDFSHLPPSLPIFQVPTCCLLPKALPSCHRASLPSFSCIRNSHLLFLFSWYSVPPCLGMAQTLVQSCEERSCNFFNFVLTSWQAERLTHGIS